MISAWLAQLVEAGEYPDLRLTDAATDVVDTMCSRPEGLVSALYRFGNTLGADGWPSTQVYDWFSVLTQLVDRPQRTRLAHFSAHASLAQGWADGYVRGAHSGMCIDPATGLATEMVLRLRLREVYELADPAFADPADAYTFVLVDVDLRYLPLLEADLVLVCAAEATRSVFQHGETIARVGDRIVVLAANSEFTVQRSEALAEALRLNAGTRRAYPMVLLDALPEAHGVLDRYFGDLVG